MSHRSNPLIPEDRLMEVEQHNNDYKVLFPLQLASLQMSPNCCSSQWYQICERLTLCSMKSCPRIFDNQPRNTNTSQPAPWSDIFVGVTLNSFLQSHFHLMTGM